MCRPSQLLSALVAVLSCAALSSPAFSADPPTGTISCDINGYLFFNDRLPLVLQPPSIRDMGVRLVETNGPCDATGVTGGKLPITNAVVTLKGRFPEGLNCVDLVSTPTFTHMRIKVAWRNDHPNTHGKQVGASKATLASASYDSGTDQLVLVTAPIARGAFAGSTLTLRMGINDPPTYDQYCTTSTVHVVGWGFGVNPSTISVP